NPQAGLIEAADGGFLGTTFEGGSANRGTVFKMDSSGAVSFLHSFTSGEGANPQAKLIQANGSIYGTTNGNGGGSTGLGTIFKIDPAGTSTTIHTFDGSGGAYPYDAGLTQGSDGSFYGTTTGWSYGTVFKVDAAGTLTTLHRFDGTDGGAPSGGGLFLGNDGSLYGTTMCGGTSGF